MLLYCLFFNIMYLPAIYGSISPPEITNKTSTSTEAPVSRVSTKIPVRSVEGGSLSPEIPLNTIAKSMDVGKTKEKSSVVARKGAFLPVDVTKSSEESADINSNITITNLNTVTKYTVKTNSSSETKSNQTSEAKAPVSELHFTLNTSVDAAKPEKKIHKPLVTSYDELSRAKFKTGNELPPLYRDSKVENSVKSHPAMVMPIVITILLVPMFAVLGYMALKRGQEAWKNRHYKRMDFLLDGMYND